MADRSMRTKKDNEEDKKLSPLSRNDGAQSIASPQTTSASRRCRETAVPAPEAAEFANHEAAQMKKVAPLSSCDKAFQMMQQQRAVLGRNLTSEEVSMIRRHAVFDDVQSNIRNDKRNTNNSILLAAALFAPEKMADFWQNMQHPSDSEDDYDQEDEDDTTEDDDSQEDDDDNQEDEDDNQEEDEDDNQEEDEDSAEDATLAYLPQQG